jgi:hypothetical protein
MWSNIKDGMLKDSWIKWQINSVTIKHTRTDIIGSSCLAVTHILFARKNTLKDFDRTTTIFLFTVIGTTDV